jgi:hypothetical protein
MRIASAAQWISKTEMSVRNQSAYVSAQKQRVRHAKERRARAAAENFRLSAQVSYSSHCDVRMLVRRESGYYRMGQRVRGYIGMGQTQRSKFLTNRIIRGPIAYNFIT